MNNKIFDVPFIRGISVTIPKEYINIRDLKFDGVNIDDVIKVTGIETIHRAPANKTVTDYCVDAAENLFKSLDFDKTQIDGIVFATDTPEYLTPGSGYIMHNRLDLSTKCIIVDINQACAGFVNGLFQAYLLVQSGYCKNVLLCVGTTPEKMYPKDKSTQVLMGNAGVATIISASETPTESAFSFYNDGKSFKALYIPAGGSKIPIKHGVTDIEEIDKNGNIRTLENTHMEGLEVMAFVIAAAPTAIKNLYKIMNWTKDDVKIFALHQANKAIITALIKRLHVPAEKVPLTLKNYGNNGISSTPLTLCLENPNARGKWDKAILCGFGNGLACAAVALDLTHTYFCEVREL